MFGMRLKADRAKDQGRHEDSTATPQLPAGAGKAFANGEAAIPNAWTCIRLRGVHGRLR